MGRRSEPTVESTAGFNQPHLAENSERRSTRGDRRSTLDRSALVQAVATGLRFLPSPTTRERQPLRLRIRQPRLGTAARRGGTAAQRAFRTAIAARLPNTPGG